MEEETTETGDKGGMEDGQWKGRRMNGKWRKGRKGERKFRA
ncbi:hypothetical protein [Flavihumibacter fluminis]|nr:hypothetical protein [Flavihumibacter fluminis]